MFDPSSLPANRVTVAISSWLTPLWSTGGGHGLPWQSPQLAIQDLLLRFQGAHLTCTNPTPPTTTGHAPFNTLTMPAQFRAAPAVLAAMAVLLIACIVVQWVVTAAAATEGRARDRQAKPIP